MYTKKRDFNKLLKYTKDGLSIQKAKQKGCLVAGCLQVFFIISEFLHLFTLHVYFFLLYTKFENNLKRRKLLKHSFIWHMSFQPQRCLHWFLSSFGGKWCTSCLTERGYWKFINRPWVSTYHVYASAVKQAFGQKNCWLCRTGALDGFFIQKKWMETRHRPDWWKLVNYQAIA